MPHRSPHPDAYFSLVPNNERALTALNHPNNQRYISTFEDPLKLGSQVSGLDIGPYIGSKSRNTLATIGRSGDIVVEGSRISRKQCSFEKYGDEVMLLDWSLTGSTQFFGETAMPFQKSRSLRRVVVDKKINLEFGFGGPMCDQYRFRIVWQCRDELLTNMSIDYPQHNPSQTRTILEEPPTDAPSQPDTSFPTPGKAEIIRFSKRGEIGRGSFGRVFKAVNIDSGEHIAIKEMQTPSVQSRERQMLKQEVEILSHISHVSYVRRRQLLSLNIDLQCQANIVEYISGQFDDKGMNFYIIMELKHGNVNNLIRNELYKNNPIAAEPLLHQMLQALDYLAYKQIIHRDVKSENILYTYSSTRYEYQLTDFGLSHMITDAQSKVGSMIYMAPELDTREEQTPKMDVWSLFITLAYAMDLDGFRTKSLLTTPLRILAAEEALSVKPFDQLKEMAVVDPSQRASAADMLDRLYAGNGRTTP